MRLRVCIIVAAALGAAGSLILAADMYRRLLQAERLAADGLLGSAGSATLVFGMTHVLGTAAMGILFLAICLLLAGERKPEKKTSFVEKKSEPPPPRAVSSASQPAVSPRVSSPSQPAVTPSSGPAQGVQAQTAAPKESPSGISEAVPAIVAPFRPPTRVTRPEGPIPSPPPKQPSVIMPVPQFPPAPEIPPAPPVPEHRPAKNIFIVQAPPAPPPSEQNPASGEPQPISETEYQRAVMERKVLDEQGDIPTATPLPDSGLHKGVGEEKPGEQKV